MPQQTHTYSIANDFPGSPNGQANPGRLHNEILADATIVTALDGINVTGDVLSIVFADALTTAEKTRLDGDTTNPAGGLIAEHNAAAPIAAAARLPGLYIAGARTSWVGVSQVKTGLAGKTSLVRDSTDRFDIEWTGELTADITLSGAGGLDTGAEQASTWYALHVIADSSAVNPVAALLSASMSAPTLPAGYDLFRRIGSVRNNGSGNFLKFFQRGDGAIRFYGYDEGNSTLLALNNGTASVYTDVDLSALVPPTSEHVMLGFTFDMGLLSIASNGFKLRPKGGGTADMEFRPGAVLADQWRQSGVMLFTNSAQKIQYVVDDTGDALTLTVQGFTDTL